jgi:hypothetical protein
MVILFKRKLKVTRECSEFKIKDIIEEYYLFSVNSFIVIDDTDILLFFFLHFKIIMAFTPYQLFLAGLMLVTGTLNTLSTKWADRY